MNQLFYRYVLGCVSTHTTWRCQRFFFSNAVKLNFNIHVLALAWWVANLFCRDKFLMLFYSVPLIMWASQHIEQCAIRTSILTEGVKSLVTLQRERFMCAVKPFEVNCILLSFCACNILCCSLYTDRGRCSPSLSLIFSSSFVPLCVQYHGVNTSSHLSLNAARVSPGSGHYVWMHLFQDSEEWSVECWGVEAGWWLRRAETLWLWPWLPPRLWLVSRSEPRPRGEDWKDSKTSNLGDLMHRVPDDCNVLRLSFTIALLLQSTVYYHTPFLAIPQ